jgi:hypothetical protein
MNSFKNEKINSTLINVEALQQEYEVTLQQYQEAGKNYIAALQYDTLNPCSRYKKDSTGISQTCYNQIWKDQGCTTQPRNAKDGWTKNQTLEHLAYDTFKWATLTDDNHRKGCYGNSTNYSTKTSPVYPNSYNPCANYTKDSKGISQYCYNKIWTDQGCITPEQNVNNGYLNKQTFDGVVNDSFQWATLTDDNHRKGCYGNSTNYSTKTSPVYPDTSDTSTNKNNNKSYFSALKGRTWWGAASLSEGPASTQAECETMCANSDKCSGATFNPVKRYCWTRTGDGIITTGQDDDYALISQQREALSAMKGLNDKLLDLNNQIASEFINPEVKQQDIDKNVKQQQLNVSYQKLLNQKIEIDKQLQEYYSIEQDEMNQTLYTNSQNVSLKFWVLITCLVLLVTIKQFFGSGSPPFSVTIWLFIIIVLIILAYTLNTPTGFMMWFLLLVSIILINGKILPSE